MADRAPVSSDSKDSLLVEIREAFDYDMDQWRPIRDEGKTDMLVIAGEVWEAMDSAGAASRKTLKRPMITADEVNQYINQVVNSVRANQRAVKFAPVGNGANEEGAEFYADKMREIEYRSKAQIAYTTAFENAVSRGYGFCRVNTKRSAVPGQRRNQEIWIQAIPNPDMVLPDAEALSPDASDMKRCVVYEQWNKAEFLRQFGEAKIRSFTPEHMTEAPAWVKANTVLVAEHWKVKSKLRKMVAVEVPAQPQMGQPPQPPQVRELWTDDYEKQPIPGARILDEFEADDRTVCYYLTNGLEILDERDWPGKYIPIVSCYGKVLYVDHGGGAKRVLVSMTRLMRDPYMLYCYYRTQQAEMAGMIPKTPVAAYEGQMEGYEDKWQKMNHEPLAFVYFKGKTDATGETILPPPSRLDYHAGEHLQSLELCAEGARRAIQSAAGTNFMPTSAQRRNEKSGKALDKIDEVAQRGSFHFNDHYDDMITHVGVITEDLMDKIYDTDREVGIRKANDQSAVVRINAPSQDPDTKKPIQINTKGDYQVTVSTGPAFDSTRQAETEFADLLMDTPFAPRIADLIMKLKGGGPIMDEIADRLTPPEFRKNKDNAPDPAQMMEQVQRAQMENANLKQVATQLAQDLKSRKLEIESNERLKILEIQSRERIAGSTDSTAVAVTQMKLATEASIAQMEAQITRIQSILSGQEEALARQHELALAQMGHQQSLEQSDRDIEGQIITGQQGHQQALEQMAAEPVEPIVEEAVE
jgi:hypothetical protein